MNSILKFFVYFTTAPLLLLYAITILFLFINGVSGSQAWLMKLWNGSKAWWLLAALLLGSIFWVVFAFKMLSQD